MCYIYKVGDWSPPLQHWFDAFEGHVGGLPSVFLLSVILVSLFKAKELGWGNAYPKRMFFSLGGTVVHLGMVNY